MDCRIRLSLLSHLQKCFHGLSHTIEVKATTTNDNGVTTAATSAVGAGEMRSARCAPAQRPIRLLGEEFVLFRDGTGAIGLIDIHTGIAVAERLSGGQIPVYGVKS